MTKQTDSRQVQRSRDAIKKGFGSLLGTKSYAAISVGEITEAANVGRSTFYRHFNGKADVLVALHADMFHQLFSESEDRERWLAETPPRELETFLSEHISSRGSSMSLSADIGADVDYIMRHVIELLVTSIEEGLGKSFGRSDSVDSSVLARSIAGIFVMCLMSPSQRIIHAEDIDLAHAIQKKIRALVMESHGNESREK